MATLFPVVRPPGFGFGRGPITHPGTAMVLTDRKDLNSNITNKTRQNETPSTDPSVCPLHTSPHPPTPCVLRTWWTSSTGTEAVSGCPPDSRWPPPAGEMRPSWPGFLASPGRRPFLQGPLSPPYPTSCSPSMVRTGRECLIPPKKTRDNTANPGLLGDIGIIFHIQKAHFVCTPALLPARDRSDVPQFQSLRD